MTVVGETEAQGTDVVRKKWGVVIGMSELGRGMSDREFITCMTALSRGSPKATLFFFALFSSLPSVGQSAYGLTIHRGQHQTKESLD